MVQIPGASKRPQGGGSFGIPEDVQEQFEKMQAQKKQQRTEKQGASSEEEVEPEVDFSDVADKLPSDQTVKKTDPEKILKDIGIELTEDDLHKFLFTQGSIAKEVVIFPKPKFTAKIRTLTTEEYDEIDELLVEEVEEHKVSRNGIETRRGMWILSYAVTELNGRPLRNLNLEKDVQRDASGNIPRKVKARLYRETLGKLAPPVINKLMRLHTTFHTAISLIVENPSSPFLSDA